ncbi:hypothetical protein OCU04_004045 [Sclerotinia nivalis]|uniref:Uncharacterized protein n=1 Tax=Sclerotinia nivalis TaxID=352851 RepID=A0A9X0AT90_9HELO|nr:hypothetical protein OCU04_004045 [Sclerotinia nivalis]
MFSNNRLKGNIIRMMSLWDVAQDVQQLAVVVVVALCEVCGRGGAVRGAVGIRDYLSRGNGFSRYWVRLDFWEACGIRNTSTYEHLRLDIMGDNPDTPWT